MPFSRTTLPQRSISSLSIWPNCCRRVRRRHRAGIDQLLLHHRIVDRRSEGVVELGDDRGRRLGRRQQAVPVVRRRFRDSPARRASARPAASDCACRRPRASALILPALICGISTGTSAKNACTWPPSRSVSAGAAPRYGTWTNFTPAAACEQFERQMRWSSRRRSTRTGSSPGLALAQRDQILGRC